LSTLAAQPARLASTAPLADQVMARLEETLRFQPPGQKLPSERQLSMQLGVSRVTVREALLRLEQDGRVSRFVGRGTFVAQAPASPKSPALTTLGLWIVGFRNRDVLNNPYFSEMMVGFETELTKRGGMCVLSLGDPADHGTGLPPMISEGRVCGALLIGAMRALSPAAWEVLRRMPFVTCGRRFQGQEANSIEPRDEEGVRLALRRLWDLGHRRIGFVGLDARFTDYELRAQTYEAFMREKGAFVPEHMSIMPYQKPVVPGVLLRGAGRPTAILAVHDGVALMALEAAREAGLRVPQDLSLIGFADTSSGSTNPPLTTVSFDKAAMGAEAARRLLDAVKHGRVAIEPALFPVKLIERSSCAPPA